MANLREDLIRILAIAQFLWCIVSVHVFAERTNTERLKEGIHTKLLGRELYQIFGTEDPSQVPEYEIVHPYTVDHNARRSQNARKRLHHTKPMYVHFNAFGLDFHMNITLNKDLVPAEHFIEHHGVNGVKRIKGRPGTYSIGKVVSDTESNVALDHTSGMGGMIIRDDEIYMITPVPRRLVLQDKSLDSHGAHIIYKRSALPKSHPANDFTCGVMGKVRAIKKNLQRRRRSTSSAKPEKTLELMLAADKTSVAYHGKEFLHSYLLAQGNIVAGMFKDATLEYPITVVITRVVIIEDASLDGANTTGQLLSKFRAWVVANNPDDDASPLHVDNAALISKSGCAGGCDVIGLAYVGICGKWSSQSISVDKGLTTALTVAHEIGHNLGLDHDGIGDSIDCPDGQYTMSSGGVDGGKGFEWSPCNSRQLNNILSGSRSWCLNDKPALPALTNVSFQHYGTVYSGDKQCELAYGKGYSHCWQYKHRCDHLYCKRPTENLCDYTTYPPAHGTYCLPHHWCIYGECVMDGTTPPPPIDGGWSDYGDYTQCNRPCGGGAQWKTRTCTNPAPQNGGKACQGHVRGHYKTCNMQACPAGTKSFRLEQCQKLSPDKYDIYSAGEPCKLICTSPTSKPYYYGNVEDGTLATAAGPDICIMGVRRKVGCDLVLESGSIPDRCGICGGDGSTCEPVSGKSTETYSSSGHHLVTTVPSGAINFQADEHGNTFSFLSVKVGDSSSLAYYVPAWSGTHSVAGASLRYIMEDYYYADKIRVTGSFTDKVRLYFVNVYYSPAQGITWKYFVPSEGNASAVEYAISGEWGSCSKTCAKGVQTRKAICRRADDKSEISAAFCKSLPKLNTSQACNDKPCPPQWYIHPWTTCSKSCGTGQRARNLTCSEFRSDQKFHTVADSLCTTAKPNVSLAENCSVIICKAEWKLGKWSPCSTTCGPGTQTQQLSCQRINADGTLVTVRDLECSTFPKPGVSQACNFDKPCPAWVIKYTACSKTCDGGLQTAYAACYVESSETRLNDSFCSTASKPNVSSIAPKACNTHACNSYEWVSKAGTCSVSCGDGIIPITVTCQRVNDNMTVSEEMCNGATKPPTTKACNAGDCPEIYEWHIETGTCSVTCGTGTITDKIVCKRRRDAAKVDDILCEVSIKPTVGSPRDCTMPKCPETYSWNVTNGACSVTCGTGLRHPVVICTRDSDKVTVDDSKCTGTKPTPGTIPCNMGECPMVYTWKEIWGSCSVTCGKGTKKSYFVCHMVATGSEMSDSYCSALAKPAPRTMECSANCGWVADRDGPCLVKCGSGKKLVTLKCENENKTEVDIKNCAAAPLGTYTSPSCGSLPACVDAAPLVKDVPKFYDVGCFKDNYDLTKRYIPTAIGNFRSSITWTNMLETVVKCARQAADPAIRAQHNMNFTFFAIQYYGECYAGDDSVATKYDQGGTSQNCYMGTGGSFVNNVYHFGSPIQTTELPAIKPLGCFADNLSSPRPLPMLLDTLRHLYANTESSAAVVVAECAKVAAKRGFKVFGIQFHGECWGGPNAESTYSEDGPSTACVHKLGGVNSFYAYKFTS